MTTYYWIGNSSNSVNNSSNWSLYPLTGLTLPPSANDIPSDGDTIIFQWPTDSDYNKPIYPPTGTLTGGILLMNVEPNFELDIGSVSTPLGISASNIQIAKKYQSSPAKGTETPSVYVHSYQANSYLQTVLLGDAPVPAAFSGSTFDAAQCVMNFSGDYRTVFYGDVTNSNVNATRSETLIFGDTVATTIGGNDAGGSGGEAVLITSAAKCKTTIVFGSECTIITPTLYDSVLQPITIVGAGTTVKLQRGADLNTNCGGIHVYRSTSSTPNQVLFARENYAGATGFDTATRTSVYDLAMLYSAEPSKEDPRVIINHGVDILGNLNITSGTFVVNPCEEATRTYGSAARAAYSVGTTPQNTPKMTLAPNCSIRSLKVYNYNPTLSVAPDINFDSRPLKTFFINQKLVEGYTGL